jgi:hypothetical protein
MALLSSLPTNWIPPTKPPVTRLQSSTTIRTALSDMAVLQILGLGALRTASGRQYINTVLIKVGLNSNIRLRLSKYISYFGKII